MPNPNPYTIHMKSFLLSRSYSFSGFFVLLVLSIPLVSFSNSEAQGLKRLRNVINNVESKAQNKIDEALDKNIDQRVDDKTDEILNKWFGTESDQHQTGSHASSGSNSSSGMSGFGAFGLNSNATTESVYEFDFMVSHLFETVENGKSTRSRMISYINNSKAYFAIQFKDLESNSGSSYQSTDAYIVMDNKNMAMVMLMTENGEQSSIAFSIPETDDNGLPEPEAVMEEENDNQQMDSELSSMISSAFGFQEIGSRTISGFSTKGYRSGDASATIEFWITEETINGYQEMIASNSSIPMLMMFAPYATMGGMIVEIVVNDRESGSKTTMRIEDGSGPTNHKINMAEWPRAM